MTPARARALLLFVAVAAFLNSLGNGFAFDDDPAVRLNPVVTEAHWKEAMLGPYWHQPGRGSRLYRPVTLTAYTAEWRLWKGDTLGFHAVSVAANALVSLLVLELLLRFVSLPGALTGALLFSVHPVHVEAVANVVGQAELWAAIAFLLACLLYLDGADWRGWKHVGRLVGLALLYLVGLGAKEIAVTLPAVLVLLELFRPSEKRLARRLEREVPVYLGLTAVLGGYLLLRWSVLGALVGQGSAAALITLPNGLRVPLGLTVWPEYLRLIVFPRSLSADYSPAMLFPATSDSARALFGLLVIVGGGAAAWATRRKAPAISLGLLWFGLVVLPVSNLFFPAGTLLGERTLYLPSVGAALALAGLVSLLAEVASGRERQLLAGLGVLAGSALLIRTVERNPSWFSTYTVFDTLAVEHPQSLLAVRARAAGLVHVGRMDDAEKRYQTALGLAPHNYGLELEVADFYGRRREWGRAEDLLRQAIASQPNAVAAYQILADQLIRRGLPREGFLTAMRGLAEAGSDRGLWASTSEAYIAKGDLEAAVRARRAALAADPSSLQDWERLAEILEHLHETAAADSARARAHALSARADGL